MKYVLMLESNSDIYLAFSSVSAGELVTLVDYSNFTISSCEPDGTGASVVLAGVEAGRPVVAGPVVGAEVEVLVAHLAAPALHALARPGLGAGPVDTAGVDLAVLTQGPFPTLVTSERKSIVKLRKIECWTGM